MSTHELYQLVHPDGTIHEITFSDLLHQAKYTVLYFYPKDNTPGCTLEAKEFTDTYDSFAQHDTQIIGVSKDSPKSHCTFIAQHQLAPSYLSDPEAIVQKQRDARGERKMYGKTYQGTLRTTVLLDSKGDELHRRSAVTAKGHAAEVLQWITTHFHTK